MKKIIVWSAMCSVLLMAADLAAEEKPVHAFHQAGKPRITKAFYGEVAGQQVYEYTLTNSQGMQVKVINYGGSITDIITPDKNGVMASVVLGFDSLSGYTGRNNALMGAVVGRVANRIANKRFTLDGKEYILTSYIHGGAHGFDKKIWNIQELPGKKEVGVKLTYLSKDGEEGYPGNLQVTITYSLTNKNELKINYFAATDKATPVVLTNHTYFNLSGNTENKVLNTALNILADQYLEAPADPIPTGRILDAKGTPFDFTAPQKIGSHISEIKEVNGYDLTFSLRNQTGRLALAASAFEPVSGRELQVYTTEPGLVFYTGNHLNESITGRGGKSFTKHGAFCIETQHFPDSPNQPAFPNTILRPGEKFTSTTIYTFLVRP
ncbi:MAG: aldose epimerase family protein [Chitinophagaceae bacterium]